MEAPFKVGQRVEFLDKIIPNSKWGDAPRIIKRGDKGVVLDINYLNVNATGNYSWYIEFSIVPSFWILANQFAPIQEQRIRIERIAVDETLRTKAVEIAAVETN